MAAKDNRRNRRLPYSGAIRVSWEDGSRGTRFAQGKCIDVSENGLRVELPIAVPAHAIVLLRAERLQLSGSASVRHVVRFGAKYLVGLSLNSGFPPRMLDSIRDAPALPPSGSL